MATRYNSNAAVLAIQDGASPGAYVRIAAVGDMPAFGHETTVHNTDTHDTEGWGTNITGLRRQRRVTLTLMRDPEDPTHDFIDTGTGLGKLSVQTPPELKNFLVHPKAQPEFALFFSAYVGSVGLPYPVDGVLMMTVELIPTGEPEHGDATAVSPNPA